MIDFNTFNETYMKNTIAIIYIRLDCKIFVHSFC